MLSLRNLLRRPTRTVLTVLGVAIGVSIVVALSATARGFRTQVNGMFSSGRAHLILSLREAADPILSYLDADLLDELRAREDIAQAEPVVIGATQVPPLAVFIFFGTTPTSPFLDQLTVLEGEALFEGGGSGDRMSLGKLSARNLKKGVGDTLKVGKRTFTIVGIHESATPLVTASALLSFEHAQEAAGLEGKMSTALVTISDFTPEGLAAAEAGIEMAHAEVDATAPAEWANAFDEFDLADQTAKVFTLLAIAIGGISVMNTMLMSVFERTREFGVLQAVGWSRGMVVREVLAEALVIAVLGGPLGILLGVGVVEGIARLEQFSWIAGDYGLDIYAMAIVVAVGMCVVGSVYPAWRATRIEPVEALRYE